MTPIAYLFCVTPDPVRISGTVVLRDDLGGQTPVNIVTTAPEEDIADTLAGVYRQLQLVANDANAPWSAPARNGSHGS
jgi:hypothetical protein